MKLIILAMVLCPSFIVVYLYSSSDDKKWERYFKNKIGKPPRPLFLKAMDLLPASGHALSLGTGIGNDEVILIEKNWRMDCIEKQETAIEIFMSNDKVRNHQTQVKVINKSFSELKEYDLANSYDFIYAGFSLPFAGSKLDHIWNLTTKKLKTGGLFAGHFFGDNREKLNAKDVAYLSKEKIMQLFL